jgi:hypothetical protein
MSTNVYDDEQVGDGFDDGFDIELDASEIESTEQLQGSSYVTEAGKYHVVVEDYDLIQRASNTYKNRETGAEEVAHRGRQVKLSMVVVAGTVASQIDRKLTLYVSLEQNAEEEGGDYPPLEKKKQDNLIRLFHSLGMCELGQKFKPKWAALPGAQCIIETEEYNKRVNVPPWYPSWRLDDPNVADVPKSPEYATMLGIDLGGDAIDDDMSDI